VSKLKSDMTDTPDLVALGRDVIAAEQKGLQALSSLLDAEFSRAVDLVLGTKDYLIVVGVGKSGHIGQKIAASFASTGTPSFFMHPTEASHGDLGMVSDNSTILAISNSGESRELRDVLNYARKNAIDVIGMTKNAQSTLGKAARVLLRLPDTPEACPNGLAPTTSTTNTLALADALVVATMTKRGFSADDFGRRHPGGKLGLQLQTVEDWLETHNIDVPRVTDADAMQAVVMTISEGRLGCAAVTDEDGLFLGLITDGDLRRAMDRDFFDKSASDIMTKNPASLDKSMRISDVVSLFAQKRISNAFILENGRPIGIIDMKTLLEEGYL